MVAGVLVCMGVGSVLAEEAKHEEKAVNASEIVNTVCAACHGEDGNKMLTPETPKLGGQAGDYLAKALHDYKAGKRKKLTAFKLFKLKNGTVIGVFHCSK